VRLAPGVLHKLVRITRLSREDLADVAGVPVAGPVLILEVWSLGHSRGLLLYLLLFLLLLLLLLA